MPPFDRRNFLKIMGAGAAATTVAGLTGCSKADSKPAEGAAAAAPGGMPEGFYDLPMKGTARILHITDVHGQLKPVYFREPNVNLGVGDAFGRPPHLVGKKLLEANGLSANTPESYAYTYLDFENAAHNYGRTGGYAHIKTLLDQLRKQAGGKQNTLTLDGGDLWQGSGTSLWTRGIDMVEASNLLGLDVMVGHWEFTYREDEVLNNVTLFKGDFIGQNVRVKEDALFGDEYAALTEKYDGRGLYDEDTGHAFRPYVIKEINGLRIAVVGQAFPRTANANPQEFFPDWSFGLREDDMISLVKEIRENEKYDGRGLYDEDTGHAFRPYVIKEINGLRIAVVGQAFPRTANANPQEFFPDWSFGLREDDMIELVEEIRENEKPDAVVLLSHNGMDVDIKMAERVPGLNAVFGGHTHDGVPKPLEVKNVEGHTCLVTNAGSNGKYVGVMDFEMKDGKLGIQYKMLPVITEWLPEDKEMSAYINQMRQTKYDDKIIESRRSDLFFNKSRLGKTYEEILSEKLAIADRVLYRRGNFMGTWDQVLCNALRHEFGADVAMSAGVRWGTTTLKGDWITMEDVMTQCSITYGETYVTEMTGKDLKAIFEGVADNLFDPDPYLQSGGDMVRVGGLDYTIDPAKKLGERISNITLDDGRKLEMDETYTVAGWASVNRTPDGPLMWDVVRNYILDTRGKDNVLKLPKINDPVLVGVASNPGIADYAGKMS